MAVTSVPRAHTSSRSPASANRRSFGVITVLACQAGDRVGSDTALIGSRMWLRMTEGTDIFDVE
jgi:hypothetical protein